MATGCRRVNIGTAALEQPGWCAAAIATWGDRVAVGLDVRGRTLAARGWTRDGGDLYEVLARLDAEGCARYVVTDVNKDGMLQGPNLQLLREVCAATDRPVVASGGITELTDLRALAGLVPVGVEGAIIGTALYEGRFTLEEALAVVSLRDASSPSRRAPSSPSSGHRLGTSGTAAHDRACEVVAARRDPVVDRSIQIGFIPDDEAGCGRVGRGGEVIPGSRGCGARASSPRPSRPRPAA
jgi:hypothetical protein